jgi:hypothetical protein
LLVAIFVLTRLYCFCCERESNEMVRPEMGPGGVEN